MEFPEKKVVLIVSITSDIGTALAKEYSKKGYEIIGTYRSRTGLSKLEGISNCHLFYCDMNDKMSMLNFFENYKELNLKWDTCILCPGTQKPVVKFFDCDFDEWSKSIHSNAIEPLRIIHEIYPLRNKNKISNVVLFAGAGSNNVVPSLSAYTTSKIMLIKMSEIMNFETEDLNVFIIGPGLTRTKMHYETLEAGREKAGANYDKTEEFMKSGEQGTAMKDIFECIYWLEEKGRDVAGGRNFSVVWDKWGNEKLADVLKSNPDMYKLRRSGNEIKVD